MGKAYNMFGRILLGYFGVLLEVRIKSTNLLNLSHNDLEQWVNWYTSSLIFLWKL